MKTLMRQAQQPAVLLFVYGSLMQGESHAGLLAAARPLGPCVSAPLFTLYDLGEYPAAMAGGSCALQGEVYALDAALLLRLDAYEECPGVYGRVMLDTPWGAAWIYLMCHAPAAAPRIASGDWRRHRAAVLDAGGVIG